MLKRGKNFPRDFLFGVSTSSYQNEGNNTNSDWYLWENLGKTATKCGVACNDYQETDRNIKILEKLGVGAYRFSIEWSRIEPREGKFDEKAIKHYKDLIKKLEKKNIEPFLTLFHFSLPIWFSQIGGFEKSENIKYFKRFVQRIASEFKSVKFWMTLNEPSAYSAASYLSGLYPPGKKNIFSFFKVMKNLVLAHETAYDVIKLLNKEAQVGMTDSEHVFELSHSGFISQKILRLVEYFANESFLENVSKDKIDFIGLDYYYRFRAKFSIKGSKYLPKYVPLNLVLPKKSRMAEQFGLEFHPKGISYLLKRLSQYKKPIYITENGIATSDEKKRTRFILEHLIEVKKAIDEGLDVRGYFFWTLFDNYEWHLGYNPTFGLMTRYKKPKKSFFFYQKVLKNRSLI
jgi:beta-glucosidase